jgi:hypothetical protein
MSASQCSTISSIPSFEPFSMTSIQMDRSRGVFLSFTPTKSATAPSRLERSLNFLQAIWHGSTSQAPAQRTGAQHGDIEPVAVVGHHDVVVADELAGLLDQLLVVAANALLPLGVQAVLPERADDAGLGAALVAGAQDSGAVSVEVGRFEVEDEGGNHLPFSMRHSAKAQCQSP